MDTNPLTCCCGGQGLIRQVIKGDGMAFIGAMGVITHKTLAPGETLLVDTNSLVSWEDSVEFDVRTTGGCCTCCCAGEGLFNTKLTGPGEVFLQSYSHGKFKNYAIEWYPWLRGNQPGYRADAVTGTTSRRWRGTPEI